MKTTYQVYKSIISVNEYIQTIKEINEYWNERRDTPQTEYMLFRGQSLDAPLLPSVLRVYNDGCKMRFKESIIVREFDSVYKNYTNDRFDNLAEKFAFMQHYNIPTRLLDWTQNSLIALYFAVNEDLENETPVVWILNSGKLNTLTTGDSSGSLWSSSELVDARLLMVKYLNGTKIHPDFERTLEYEYPTIFFNRNLLRYPIAVHPASSGNQRLAIQKGMFTIHGYSYLPIEKFVNQFQIQPDLIKLRINNTREIKKELKLMGITPRAVYPDLTGLAEEFKDPFWKSKIDIDKKQGD